ncbi:MAG: right-handed parallel beta-helix repeat-containing protein [Planctomycetota bacterium]
MQDGTTATLDEAIHRDESKILAQGRITITARFLNVDGLVQSGVTDIEFDVAASFVPPQFVTNFTDDTGATLPGISFGADGVPVDGYWDPARQAFVLEDIEPEGGQITIAGQLLSTGNGRLKVASGLTGLDIDNQSPYGLILGNIDTTKDRVGKITVIDSGLLTKTEYEVVGGQIRETDFTGTLNSGGTPAIIYTPIGAPVNYNFGDTIQYALPAGLHYVWTEGQDKVQLDKRIYEKKTFNLFGDFLADELAADNDWKHREIIPLDDEPLLDSETRELEGTNAPGGEELVPAYANGSAYSLRYEQRRDTSVELFTNVSQVRHPPEPTGSVYLYIGANNPADLVLASINYGDTNNWTNLSALDPGDAAYVDPATFTQDVGNNRFESSYVNSEKTIDGPTCTGGGWLRTKTCTTKIDITTGIKDFYTHTLKADYPIAILFDQGPATPLTSIRSGGDILFEGNVQTPLIGNVTIESFQGDVTNVPGTVLFGPSPTVNAGGEVLLTVEGDRGPINVFAQGDVDLEAISLDNVTSSLEVGVINSAEGDVFVDAANGIAAESFASLVRGEIIELHAVSGEIGNFDLPIPIDTSRSDGSFPPMGGEEPEPAQNGDARGGLVAVAQGDIRVREVLGNLVLTESQRGSTPASVYSEAGDVAITVTTGSLLDGVDELFRPSAILNTANVPSDTLQFLQQGANQGLWNFESVNYSVSPGLATFLYPHVDTLGTSPPSFAVEFDNVVGNRVSISTPSLDSDVGELQDIVSINDPANANALTVLQKDVLSVANASDVIGVQYELFEFIAADEANVDLLNEDYSDAARWQPIAINHRTGTTAATRTVSTNQTVLNQFDLDFFGLYRYLGSTAQLDLFAQNYNDASLWQRLTADHATDSGTPSVTTGQLVANKFEVESLSVRLSDQVMVNARTALVVTAHDRVTIAAPNAMLIERIEAGGDTKLSAAASIVDLGVGDAAVATLASLQMRAGSQILGNAASAPMRTQIGNAGLLRADAVAGIDLVQVAADTNINGSGVPINDLFVSRADSAMTVDIFVEEGDLIVGRVLSSSDVILTAQSDIFDAFSDTGAEVVNVTTNNPIAPPSGDVVLNAGGQIGTSLNYLDVSLLVGSLSTTSGGDQFVHSVRDVDVEDMTSAAGSVSLRSEGLADLGVINALAGNALVEARDEILDRDADAASDINAINITLSSSDSRVGELLNDLEIDSANGGMLDATARFDINVTEVSDSLTLNRAISSGLGHVRLTVVESVGSGDDLILPIGGMISVTDGALWLQVGDDITLAGPVTAPRSYITGDYLDADAAGSNVTISGPFNGGNTIFLETADGDDVIAISGVNVPTHIRTHGGDDDVTGGQNSDDIDGGSGVDIIRGGPGNDTLLAGSGVGDQLFGDDGDDLLVGSDEGAESDPNFADAVRFGDVIQGGGGDDRIYALGGADLIIGGPGEDWVDAGSGSDNTSGGDGNDTIFAGVGLAEFVDGGADDDQIWGSNNGDDTLFGGPGIDDIRGQAGDDTIDGGDGPDFIDGGAGTDDLRGGTGDDEILGGGGVGDQLRGEDGDDVLRGSDDGADLIFGGAGRDRAFGGGGNDSIEGGPGDDILRGEAGDDTISGDAGSDVILGGADHDVLYALNVGAVGADGSVDYVYGDFGTDNDEPGSGGDQLFGDNGIDVLFGEGGDDLIDDDAQVGGIPTPGTVPDTIEYGNGEAADPTQFVSPTATPAPPVDPPAPGLEFGSSTLPSGADDVGRWGELAGSATGRGLSGDLAPSTSPSIASSGDETFVAWSDSRSGNQQVYVARHDVGGWSELGASAGFGGVSGSVPASTQPSIAVDVGGAPVVAWTESEVGGTNIHVARWDGVAWLAMGSSLGVGGISASGEASNPIVVETSFGTVVAWEERVAGEVQAYARVFSGGSWQELAGSGSSGGISNAMSGSGVGQLTVTSVAGSIAVGWTAFDAASGMRQVYVREYTGSAWAGIAGSDSGTGVSGSLVGAVPATVTNNSDPTLAYFGSSLWVGWVGSSDRATVLAIAEYDGSASQPILQQTMSDVGRMQMPQLSASATEMTLNWVHQPLRDQSLAIYSRRFDGSVFSEFISGDAVEQGVTRGSITNIESIQATSEPTAIVFVDYVDGSPEIKVRRNSELTGTIHNATATGMTVQQILDAESLGAGDAIVVNGTITENITISSADAGVSILGAAGAQLVGNVTVNGDDVVLQRLNVIGDVTTNANRTAIRESDITGSVLFDGGIQSQISQTVIQVPSGQVGLLLVGGAADTTVRSNTITGGSIGISIGDSTAVLPGAATNATISDNTLNGSTIGLAINEVGSGMIRQNHISAVATGLEIGAVWTGQIVSNEISGANVGVQYDAASEFIGNRIDGNTTGVVATVDSLTEGLGYVGAEVANDISNNTTGLQLTGRARGQNITSNTIGVSGSGILGGENSVFPNVIDDNVTGVSAFTGTIQFNRFESNQTGVAATNDQTIFRNVFVHNVIAGVDTDGATDVRVLANTMHALTGDNIRVVGGSSEVEIRNNILWVESGYDIFVDNASQGGFFSDYNALYSSGTGRLVHWVVTADGTVLDFTDILDWQEDVHVHDLNSIGTTVVNPGWAKPQFAGLARGDYDIDSVTAGLRITSPTENAADPLSVLDWDRVTVNQLANTGFESGLTSWTTNLAASILGASPDPYSGSSYFYGGPDPTSFAEQTIDLIAAGFTASEIDDRDLTVAFGGRVRSTDGDTGQIVLTFLDGGNLEIASTTALASNVADRWELVGDRLAIPQNTRSIRYRFEGTRLSGTANDARLDDAFVYVRGEDSAVAQGADGDQDLARILDRPEIALRSPDLYVDFQRDLPGLIEWDSFGNTDDLPVRIDLLQDTPSGPVFHTNIVAVTDDDGQFSWTPADDLIGYGTFGWRIQISLVGDAISFDRSAETFAVPENTNTFYVNDGSSVGDQYTSALGNNRSTGKTPSTPKPYPNNVLRIYSLGANQTLFQDAGTYHAFSPTVISNIVGVGDDEGFIWTGPDLPASGVADNLPAHPATDAPVVLLDDSDQTTLRYLTLRDSRFGVHARAGSTAFTGEALTVRGHSEDGIYIQDDSEFTMLIDVVSVNNGQHGIHLDSSIASISGGQIESNAADGINATDQADLTISDVSVFNNARGIFVENTFNTGQTLIENSEIAGSSGDGLDVSGGTTVRLNAVHSNAAIGIDVARDALVDQNVIFGNDIGVSAGNFSSGNITISRNRLYDNSTVGVDTWSNNVTQQNTIYSSPIGIRTNTSSAGYRGDLDRNLIYDTTQQAILLRAASNANVTGNTLYTTQGSGLRMEQNTSGTVLRNNVFTSIDSTALSFDTNSQVGIDSDFNLFHVLGTGNVALWQATPRPTLSSWRNAAFTDSQSLEQDPVFVDPDGVGNVLGFVDTLDDGRDDDFHLQSDVGRFTGSLSPVYDAGTGRATSLASVELVDAVQSPAIDRGDAAFDFADEPSPSGGFVNLGAYGNSALASKSPTQFVSLIAPDGGEVWLQNQAFDVIWRSDLLGAGTTVDITLLKDGDAGFSRLIGDDVSNTGEFNWLIPGDVAADTDYRIEVTRNDMPTLSDTSGSVFEISEPISNYYVSVSGDDANSGLSPGEPKASIAGVLQAYDLEPGDTVIVGPGTYSVDSNILLQPEDSGVLIQGTTDVDGSLLTILDRGNTATGNYVFELDGGDDIVLESLSMTGGERGIDGSTTSDSDRIIVRGSQISGNAREQIWIRTSNDEFTIENSEVIGGSSFQGVRIQSDAAVVRGNQVSGSSNGVWLSGAASRVEDNTFFANSTGLRLDRNADTGAVVLNNQAHSNSTGIHVSSFNSTPTLVSGNEVFANSLVGIYGAYDVLVTDSIAWENDSIGIQVTFDSIAENNIAFSNGIGLSAGAFSASATIQDNTAYDNDIGIRGFSSSVIEGNTAFDNRIGIATANSNVGRVQIFNNLIYDSQEYSIEVAAGRAGTLIRNNTLYEPTASGVHLNQSSTGIELRNNVVEIQTGFAYDVDANSQSGFASDYNLIYAPAPGALALWGAQQFDSRADWVYELGFDFNSRFGKSAGDEPGFVSPSGSDGLLGYDSTTVGSATIVDDGDASFTVSAGAAGPATGFDGDSTLLNENASAQWEFVGLTPGTTYEVSVTFPDGNYTSSAEYAIVDSGGAALRRNINQRFRGLGTTNPLWLKLSDVTMIGDTLTIQLQDGNGTTVADAVRIREIVGDASSDDNFRLVAGSAGVDAGSLIDDFSLEPAQSGRRINLGFHGGTPNATASPADVVQVLNPRGLEKITVGETVSIDLHVAGDWVTPTADDSYHATVTSTGAIAHWTLGDTDGVNAVDQIGGFDGLLVDAPQQDQTGIFGPLRDTAMTFDGVNGFVSVADAPALNPTVFSVSGWVNPTSGISSFDSVIAKTTNTGFSDGFGIYYLNGRIHFFVDQWSSTLDAQAPIELNEWSHVAATFDGDTARLYLNGEFVDERSGVTLDPTSAPLEIGRAGGSNSYVWRGGLDEIAFYESVLDASVIEQLANLNPVVTVDLELIDATTGSLVTVIADDVSVQGSYDWAVPNGLAPDVEYRVRVTAASDPSISAQSYEPFLIVNDGADYFVNDSSSVGDVYTTALGSNAGSGKSPASPMASLPALLAAYDLGPGDRVFVDGGTYTIFKNLVIDAEDSGVTIIGAQPTPAVPNPTPTILDRGNTSSNSYVFELIDADDITLDSLELRNAYTAIYASSTSDSDDFTLRNSRVEGTTNHGVYLRDTNENATILNTSFDHSSRANNNLALLRIESANAIVDGNQFSNGGRGVDLHNQAGHLVENNVFNNFVGNALSQNQGTINSSVVFRSNRFVNVATGIYVVERTNTVSPSLVENNVVRNYVNYGIDASGPVQVQSNEIAYGTGVGIGIRGTSGAVIEDNVVSNGQYGISVGAFSNSASATNNRTYGNSIAGIRAYNISTLESNHVYSNDVGIQYEPSNSGNRVVSRGNLIYDNTSAGFRVRQTRTGALLINNTISQPVGRGVELIQDSGFTKLRNNIIEVGSGEAIFVDAASEYLVDSDYNVIYVPGPASLGLWDDHAFDDAAQWYYQLGLDQHSIVGDAATNDPLFVDPDGPNNSRGFDSTPIGAPVIIDDGDAGFSTTLAWTSEASAGFGGDSLRARQIGDDFPTATWTFSGLVDGGTYEVAATWPTGNYSTISDFVISDADGQIASVRESQGNTTPDDFVDVVGWENLGTFEIVGETLTVSLVADDRFRDTIADAIRIQQIVGDSGADDDFHVEPASPAVDAGELVLAETASFVNEPSPNGNRINAGAFGGTSEATVSADATLQIVAPGDLEKVRHGETLEIRWHTAGTSVLQDETTQTLADHFALSPLAYWRLNENAGSSVSDISGNGFDGSVIGTPTLGEVGVFPNAGVTAFSFALDNDYIEVADDPSLNPTEFSVEAWINPAGNVSTFDHVISKTTSSSLNDGFGIYSRSGQIYFFVNQHDPTLNPRFTFTAGEWTHVTGTFDGTTARLYADGALVGEQLIAAPLDMSNSPLEIGRARTSSYTWKGLIDEVAMYDRALTPAEVVTAASVSPLSSVDIELVDVNSGTTTPIASDVVARGSYDWTVPVSIPSNEYRIRIMSNDSSGVTAEHRDSIQIVSAGNEFFVNDASLTNDVYTSVIGLNRNDGLSPSSPMADLRALVQAYDLGPGDVVHVDTGDYELLRNLFLDASDSGVAIRGPSGAQTATLTRDNSTSLSRVVELTGADDITLDSLSLTGANIGVHAGANVDSDGVTLSNLEVFHHASDQIFIESTNDEVTIVDSRVFDDNAGADGIEIRGVNNTLLRNEIFGHRYGIFQSSGGGNLIADNEVYDNTLYGIYTVLNLASLGQQRVIGNDTYGNPVGIYAQTNINQERVLVSGNRVENNATYGIQANGNIDVFSNQVFDNPGIGIYQQSTNSVSDGNVVYGNDVGIQVGTFSIGASAYRNRVFNNATYGIRAFRTSQLVGNYVYSNSVGIFADGASGFPYTGEIFNNLIYVNTNQGILVDVAGEGLEINGNTILQPVGDAIRLIGGGRDAEVRNNAIQFDSGYGVFVESGSTTNLLFERNLYRQGPDPNAFVGHWAGTDADLIADWQAVSGTGFSSLEADPDFIDIDGADNTIGYDPLANSGNGYDGGLDDNFIVRKDSPTIDRGNGNFATGTDIQGSPRLDDPDTANVGAPQFSSETDLGSNLFDDDGGIAQNWRGFGSRWNYLLPFTFNYAGADYNDVWVSASGFLQFGSSANAGDTNNSTEKLNDYPRVAPLWDRIATNGTNEDIFVDTTIADQVTIRWAGRNIDNNGKVNFSVTLFSTGAIEFHYGDANANLTPTIGLSGYEGRAFDTLLASIDGATTLTNQNSLRFEPAAGSVDIGAYEFRGESSDVVPPQVTMSSPPAVENQSITTLGIESIGVIFSEEVNNIDAAAPAAYDLRASGPNGLFGDGDDIVYSVLPQFTLGDDFVTLEIAEGILPPGDYRLRIPSGLSRSIHDTAGLRLDGDGDGTEGGDFERLFTVAVNQQPTADPQSVQAVEDTELPIVLTGDDGDPAITQDLTYWLTSLPTNGTIATSPGGPALDVADLPIAVPAQLYFTPEQDSNAPEGFDFYVQDDGSTANGGLDTSATARITITIQPVNDAPTDVVLGNHLVTENTDTSSADLFVGTLTAVDVDLGDTHTFEFASGGGDTDNGSFLIVGDSLFLRQNESIDYELLPSYSVRVAAVDASGARVERPLSIDVLNLPEVAALRYDQNEPGNNQRSVFASLTVVFDQVVNVSDASFDFIKLGIANPVDAVVDFTLSTDQVGGVTEATLLFSGQHMNPFGSSLVDGNYQLTVNGSNVTDLMGTLLDGDQDGVAGGDSVFGESPLDLIYRFLGDSDGDRDMDGQDFGRFAQTFFLTSEDPGFNAAFDSDGDGDVDGQDYGRISGNLFEVFPFP